MRMDDSRFPLVLLRAHEDEEISSVDEVLERNRQFEALLDRRAPFVLIADHAEHDHDGETAVERKEKALFFKRIKDRMRAYCIGLIVIEGHAPSTAARIAATAASKALGFAVQFASDETSATEKAVALLERKAAAAS